MEKVIVIGIDGLGWELLDRLIEHDDVPNIKKAIREGTSSKLLSIIPPSSGPSWTSFATGKEVNKNGCYDYAIFKNNFKDFHILSSKCIKGKTIYEIIEENNLNPIIINLLNNYPPRLKKGITITSGLTRGPNCVFPETLKEKYPLFKKYKILPNEIYETKGNIQGYLQESIEVEQIRFDCAKELFNNEKWDFFYLLFGTTDGVQHKRYDKLLEGTDPLALQLFKNIDSYVGWFMNNMPKDTTLIIMSDHTFRSYKSIFYVNKWLEQNGFLKTINKIPNQINQEDLPEKSKKEITYEKKKIKLNIGHLIRKLLYKKFIFKIASIAYRKLSLNNLFSLNFKLDIDFENSKVIKAPSTTASYLYVNDWRFAGPVKTKEEKNKKINEVILGLRDLKDKNGNIVLKKVSKAQEVYKGEIPENFPDIILEMEDYIIYDELNLPNMLEEKMQNSHYPDGILVCYGNHICKEALKNKKPKITDLAPTILKIMNLPIPKDMDGKVLQLIKPQKQKKIKN